MFFFIKLPSTVSATHCKARYLLGLYFYEKFPMDHVLPTYDLISLSTEQSIDSDAGALGFYDIFTVN
jgi:hypothetical protein